MDPHSNARLLAARRRGFTLLELIVVCGLLAVLAGIGVGFLQRADTSRSAAMSAVSAEVRRAANTARSTGLPTEVVFSTGDPTATGGAAAPSEVWARVLAPVGAWRFEPDERQLVAALEPESNADYGPGRFGRAARFDFDGKGALLSVAMSGARFDLRDGFALRMDLRLERSEVMVLARIGQGFELRLDEGLVPSARLVTADGEQSGVQVTMRADRAVELDRWQRVEFVYDRRRLSLVIEGREVAAVEASAAPFQRDDEVFEVSPGDAPIEGWVDEVELLAYDLSEPQILPLEVELTRAAVVRFDGQGDPLPPATFEWMLHGDDVLEEFRIKAGGVIQ